MDYITDKYKLERPYDTKGPDFQQDKEMLDFYCDFSKNRRYYTSVEQFEKDLSEVWLNYRRHVNIARILFKDDLYMLRKLYLHASIVGFVGSWVMSAQTFYLTILGNVTLMTLLEKNGVPTNQLKIGLSVLLSLENSEYFEEAQLKEEMELENKQTEAFNNLYEYSEGLRKAMREALKDDPEKCKMYGLDEDDDNSIGK